MSLQGASTSVGIVQDIFSLPVTGNAEGSSDDNPIHLDGVRKEEFKRFLEVLFNMGTREDANMIFEMWFPVVKLAHFWEFDAIHKFAIKNMPYRLIDKTSAEKVALAVDYGIRPWLLPGLNELARRKEPLGNGDLALLGPELALKVAAVRESLRATDDTYPIEPHLTCGPRDASKVDFTPVIRHMFEVLYHCSFRPFHLHASEMIMISMLLDDDVRESRGMTRTAL